MDSIFIKIAGAIFTEAVVSVIKTWFSHINKQEWAISLWAIISSIIGIFIAFALQINIVDIVKATNGFGYYVSIIITGIVIGRGANFVYDIIAKIQIK